MKRSNILKNILAWVLVIPLLFAFLFYKGIKKVYDILAK